MGRTKPNNNKEEKFENGNKFQFPGKDSTNIKANVL